jgi:hypothetical protein
MEMDSVIDQAYDRYTDEDHAVWHELYNRQTALLSQSPRTASPNIHVCPMRWNFSPDGGSSQCRA